MAHGLSSVIKRATLQQCKPEGGKTGVGSRRIFSPQFKLQVLDSYRNDADCKGNQRATARKYGIHRRQIQKWLQVENTLRNNNNSNGAKQQPMALNGHRQRDDDQRHRSASLAAGTANEEARVPEPPSGWRQNQQQQAPTTCMVPIDLSLRKQLDGAATPTPPPPTAIVNFPPTSSSPRLHPEVWDLSTKPTNNNKRKLVEENNNKKVKLFKPYLLDDIKEESSYNKTPSPVNLYCCQPEIYNNNNIEYHPAYTLHELQPKTFYPCYPHYTYPNLSPTYHPYDDPLRHQSYSLDFKLSAIDCYYQDSLCKGNPRAVLTKYNILRSEKDSHDVR